MTTSTLQVQELDSWYFKFKRLLFSGYDANLQLISKDGNASVTLSAELGSIEFKAKGSHQKKNYETSQIVKAPLTHPPPRLLCT